MKITRLETFIVDGGWRPWTFVKVETDEGVTGWGECSDTRAPHAVCGAVRDLRNDPRRTGSARTRSALLRHGACAALECGRHRGASDRRNRVRAARHQGTRARYLRRGASRRADSRAGAPLLVALRHDARASPRDRRQTADPQLGRHHGAREGSRLTRLHRAQDEHRSCRAKAARGSAVSTARWGRTTSGRRTG